MKFYKHFVIILIVLLSISHCARRGNPSGGPKDEDAPISIKTVPEYKTIHFDKKEINIYFDEYIKLKDLKKNLIISPPLKYPADITPLGIPSKKITIKIKDTLVENTTYTFNFGESIIDNNEGNVLSGFKYIFSTGNHIDSLSIKGTITDAINKKSDKYVAVMLYEANKLFNDSTIYKEKPIYVTNTLDSLAWEISNLKKGKYHLLAIKEEANDYLFNPRTDKIAFIDSVISIPSEKTFNLNLFKEIPKFKTSKPVEIAKGHLVFPFFGDASHLKVEVNLEKSNISDLTNVQFLEKEKDTLNYYFSTDKKIDSLFFNIKNKDYAVEEKVILRSKQTDTLIVKSNIRGTFNFNDTLIFTTNNPLKSYKKDLFSIYDKDTVAVKFDLKQSEQRDLLVLFDKKETQKYHVKVLPNAITDFFNQMNKDTINLHLRTKKKDNYGSINLAVQNPSKKSIIIQLLNLKEEIIAEKVIATENKATFNLLNPAKYLVRVIYDDNKNGKWDTGNYLKKLQPEKVFYFGKEIEVKENWFVNENIEIK